MNSRLIRPGDQIVAGLTAQKPGVDPACDVVAVKDALDRLSRTGLQWKSIECSRTPDWRMPSMSMVIVNAGGRVISAARIERALRRFAVDGRYRLSITPVGCPRICQTDEASSYVVRFARDWSFLDTKEAIDRVIAGFGIELMQPWVSGKMLADGRMPFSRVLRLPQWYVPAAEAVLIAAIQRRLDMLALSLGCPVTLLRCEHEYCCNDDWYAAA